MATRSVGSMSNICSSVSAFSSAQTFKVVFAHSAQPIKAFQPVSQKFPQWRFEKQRLIPVSLTVGVRVSSFRFHGRSATGSPLPTPPLAPTNRFGGGGVKRRHLMRPLCLRRSIMWCVRHCTLRQVGFRAPQHFRSSRDASYLWGFALPSPFTFLTRCSMSGTADPQKSLKMDVEDGRIFLFLCYRKFVKSNPAITPQQGVRETHAHARVQRYYVI